ncbi:MAG: carboxypeptidase-like regulatory domain-containing protein [Steroidobacter sp.]
MSLRRRYSVLLVLALVLGLMWFGRALFRSNDAEHASEKVATIAAVENPPLESATPPAIVQPASVAAPVASNPTNVGMLRGRVIDAGTRQPVREFELEFFGSRDARAVNEIPGARKFNTKDGRFEWPDLPTRHWMLKASARGYQRFELDDLWIQEGVATAEIILPLRRGQALRGRVYDEKSGAGIAAAVITFRESNVGRYEGNFRERVRAETGKNGSFAFDGVPKGSIVLSVSASKYMAREIDVLVSEQTSPLQIALSAGGAITGYLTRADGRTPVVGHISVTTGGSSSSKPTSDAGEFSFERLPPGNYKVRGRTANQTAKLEFFLAKDERKDGVVIALSEGRTIRGVITGLSAADLRLVHVMLLPRDGSYTGSTNESPGASGAYEIHGVAPGEAQLIANVAGRRQISKTVQVPADADLTVDLAFPRGVRLSGNVTRGGKPVSRALLQPRPVLEQALHIEGAITSDRGEYLIEDLPKGDYYMLVDSYRSHTFEVSGDTVLDIDVPTTNFAGRTVEEGGNVPIVGVDVDLLPTTSEQARLLWRERSNHFGEFTFSGLEPGSYLLSAYKPGYEMHRERISHGATVGDMTIRLRPDQGVEIRMREAEGGQPIHKAVLRETIGDRPGTGFSFRLDENGVGHVPGALAGSTLTFDAGGYVPAVVRDWDGQPLDLQLEKQRKQ